MPSAWRVPTLGSESAAAPSVVRSVHRLRCRRVLLGSRRWMAPTGLRRRGCSGLHLTSGADPAFAMCTSSCMVPVHLRALGRIQCWAWHRPWWHGPVLGTTFRRRTCRPVKGAFGLRGPRRWQRMSTPAGLIGGRQPWRSLVACATTGTCEIQGPSTVNSDSTKGTQQVS